MKSLMIILPATIALVACNSEPTVSAENASVADVAKATQEAVKLQPGKWETQIAILSVEGPGVSPELARSMTQQTQGHKVETCLTPEMAAKPPQDMLGAAKSCTYEKFEMTGGNMTATLVCKNEPGMPAVNMRASMSGKFASTNYDITSESTMDMPAMPGGPAGGGKMTTKTQVTGKRLGECDAPQAS